MWTIDRVSDTVTRMRIPYSHSNDWEFRILLTSDRHIDSIHSDHDLQLKHLETAKKNNWPVIDLGDFFDSMAGKFDPRRSRLTRADFKDKEEYYDALVNYGQDFLKDYLNQFALLGKGNHEATVLKHAETNLLKRLVRRMNELGSPVVAGAFAGWIKLMFEASGGARKSINIRYTHGAGGSAPVTKGVIKTNRRGIVYPDANIIISGHTHDSWLFPIPRERLTDHGIAYVDEQLHISLPSYKDATTNQSDGFEIEKEFSPKTKGAVWLKFFYDKKYRIVYDVERVIR